MKAGYLSAHGNETSQSAKRNAAWKLTKTGYANGDPADMVISNPKRRRAIDITPNRK
jgi:hypothetical protein